MSKSSKEKGGAPAPIARVDSVSTRNLPDVLMKTMTSGNLQKVKVGAGQAQSGSSGNNSGGGSNSSNSQSEPKKS